MENKQMKCIKGESCLHCGSNYCRFVDELDQLKASKEQAEQKLEKIRELATALCYTVMSDGVAILQKDILQIIDEVEE